VEFPRKFVRHRDEEDGDEPKLHTPEEFIELFKNSSHYQDLLAEIAKEKSKIIEAYVL